MIGKRERALQIYCGGEGRKDHFVCWIIYLGVILKEAGAGCINYKPHDMEVPCIIIGTLELLNEQQQLFQVAIFLAKFMPGVSMSADASATSFKQEKHIHPIV